MVARRGRERGDIIIIIIIVVATPDGWW